MNENAAKEDKYRNRFKNVKERVRNIIIVIIVS